jgi:hypothetical protein
VNHQDFRERDVIRKLLRRRPIDPLAPLKKTTPELMAELTAGITVEYEGGAPIRTDEAKRLMGELRKDNR